MQLRATQRKLSGWIERHAAGVLMAATILVGIAILLDGAAAKTFNGFAGVLWIAVAGVLVGRSLRSGQWRPIACALLIALVLVNLAKPSDLLLAVIGFGVGGGLLALATGTRDERGVVLLPALWLPTHLLSAAVRAVALALRGLPAPVRTDPPPTAALVPLAMVVASYLGGMAVICWRERARAAPEAPEQLPEV